MRNVELFAGEQFGFWVTLSGRAGAIRFGEHELLAAAGDSATVAPWQARLFLYCMLRLTGEFHGGGRTLDSAGNEFGPTEWLVKNVPIEKMLRLGGVCVEVSRDCVAFPETMRDSLRATPYYSQFQNWSRP